MLEISPFEPSIAEDIAHFYNRATSLTPFCYPVTSDILDEAVFSKSDFEPEGLFVAVERGEVKGFIHAGCLETAPDDPKKGSIFLFIAQERDVCLALLDKAVHSLKARGAQVCHTMSNDSESNRYYSGVHMGYEVALWQGFYQVVAAFERHPDFDLTRQRFFMSLSMAHQPDVVEPRMEVRFAVEDKGRTGSFYSTAEVCAVADGERLGACTFHYLDRLSAHLGTGIGQIQIGVDERYRRKGIASALLSRAHRELYSRGARKVILTTNYELYPAMKLYEKTGYSREPVNAPVYTAHF